MMASSIRIMDTSIYLTILGVPKHERGDEARIAQLRDEFRKLFENNTLIILPLGTIIETGNHIASAPDGRRHDIVIRFIEDVKAAISGEAPYSLGKISESALQEWLDLFQKLAISSTEFGDVTCIAEFYRCIDMFPAKPVSIWSDDSELQSYSSYVMSNP